MMMLVVVGGARVLCPRLNRVDAQLVTSEEGLCQLHEVIVHR